MQIEQEGLQRNDNKREINKHTHLFFIDNLPDGIQTRMLYKEFGWYGGVVDIFVSRKQRRSVYGLFAFVGFDARGGTIRAVEHLNGRVLDRKKILICMARFGRIEMLKLPLKTVAPGAM
ncbi:hypothetical protein PIB30_097699 [Stylosanthes scabra]|uniref:RRM domain-containing protein n=1 Tax=Stylosanthes scabra TaxID=79078 RepID=A0ABU6ZVV2_9FABA|nr:hypothetical protein [Stylosanthes scabra]